MSSSEAVLASTTWSVGSSFHQIRHAHGLGLTYVFFILIPNKLLLVLGGRLELPRLTAYAPQAYMFTNYITRAFYIYT